MSLYLRSTVASWVFMYICMRWLEINFRCFSKWLSTLISEKVSLIWGFPIRLCWLATKAQETRLHLLSTRITSVHHHTNFDWVLGSELDFSCFESKYLKDWAISPVLERWVSVCLQLAIHPPSISYFSELLCFHSLNGNLYLATGLFKYINGIWEFSMTTERGTA